MTTNKLFEKALGLSKPWNIEKIDFDAEAKRLDIFLDIQKEYFR